MKQYILILIAVFAMSACASIGKDYNESNISLIKPGETTKVQTVAMFGQPMSKSMTSDGEEAYTWAYTKAILASAKTKNLTIFYKNGVVTKYTQGLSAL